MSWTNDARRHPPPVDFRRLEEELHREWQEGMAAQSPQPATEFFVFSRQPYVMPHQIYMNFVRPTGAVTPHQQDAIGVYELPEEAYE